MTVCNMSIEMGARGGMIAPDETTFDYLRGREFAPKGREWDRAVERWKTLRSEEDAVFDADLSDTSLYSVLWLKEGDRVTLTYEQGYDRHSVRAVETD